MLEPRAQILFDPDLLEQAEGIARQLCNALGHNHVMVNLIGLAVVRELLQDNFPLSDFDLRRGMFYRPLYGEIPSITNWTEFSEATTDMVEHITMKLADAGYTGDFHTTTGRKRLDNNSDDS